MLLLFIRFCNGYNYYNCYEADICFQTNKTNEQKIQKSSYHQFFVRLFLHEKAGLAEIEYVPNKTIIIKTKHTSDNEKPKMCRTDDIESFQCNLS